MQTVKQTTVIWRKNNSREVSQWFWKCGAVTQGWQGCQFIINVLSDQQTNASFHIRLSNKPCDITFVQSVTIT